ncbi:MAG: AMP-binding protein, partial [Acidobacteria bacterium]|nr:AMP-binding protein [Acidobacteriota bacterium]
MVSYFENWADDLDRPMLHFEGRSWTRRAFIEEVQRLSLYFRGFGVSSGSRVLIMLENSPQLLFSVFASHRLGSIVVPLNPRYSEAEVDYV